MSYDTSKVLFTATQLTLTGPSTATVVFVQNLAEPDDGLGGVFSWFPESEAADDGLNVFQPADTSGAGRWVRLSGEFVPDSTFTIPIEFAEDVTFDQDLLLDDASVIDWNSDTTIARSAAGKLATSGLVVTATATNSYGIDSTGVGNGGGVKGTGGGTGGIGGYFVGGAGTWASVGAQS